MTPFELKRYRRDQQIRALYDASAALERAKNATTDPTHLARISHLAEDMLDLIGKVTVAKIVEVVSP